MNLQNFQVALRGLMSPAKLQNRSNKHQDHLLKLFIQNLKTISLSTHTIKTFSLQSANLEKPLKKKFSNELNSDSLDSTVCLMYGNYAKLERKRAVDETKEKRFKVMNCTFFFIIIFDGGIEIFMVSIKMT